MEGQITYSNPRMEAFFEDWPWGSKLKTKARFIVEANKRGERVARELIDPRNGRRCKAHYTTYARRCRIVDGSDGHTYIVQALDPYGFHVFQWNLQFTQEYIRENDSRYGALVALFSEDKISELIAGSFRLHPAKEGGSNG